MRFFIAVLGSCYLWSALILSAETAPKKAGDRHPPQSNPKAYEITSDKLEMQNGTVQNVFIFTGNVRIKNEAFIAKANQMTVKSLPAHANIAAPTGEVGGIEIILADGNVEVDQPERHITSGHAEIFPAEGKIIFTEKPIIKDNQGTVQGKRITLFQGQKKALVEGEEDNRPTVTLASQDTNFNVDKDTAELEKTAEAPSSTSKINERVKETSDNQPLTHSKGTPKKAGK